MARLAGRLVIQAAGRCSNMAVQSLITLTTDFGLDDVYAGVMKGVMLSINPACVIVDITHGIAPHDIEAGAQALDEAARYFPDGTVHVAVVDPGVGGSRRPVVAVTDAGLFVGPDNGIFSFALTGTGPCAVYELTEKKYFLPELSPTFHGRDVFAPAAAHLTKGVPPGAMGRRIDDPVVLPALLPELREDTLEARILRCDRFGNLVTNIRRDMLDGFVRGSLLRAECRATAITRLLPFYGAARDGELFCIIGSGGRLEISLKNGSAAVRLAAGRGDGVVLRKIS